MLTGALNKTTRPFRLTGQSAVFDHNPWALVEYTDGLWCEDGEPDQATTSSINPNGKFITEVRRLESEISEPNLAALLLQRRQIDILEQIATALEIKGRGCNAENDAQIKRIQEEMVQFRRWFSDLYNTGEFDMYAN